MQHSSSSSTSSADTCRWLANSVTPKCRVLVRNSDCIWKNLVGGVCYISVLSDSLPWLVHSICHLLHQYVQLLLVVLFFLQQVWRSRHVLWSRGRSQSQFIWFLYLMWKWRLVFGRCAMGKAKNQTEGKPMHKELWDLVLLPFNSHNSFLRQVHIFLSMVITESESVSRSVWTTLCDSMDYSPPGFSVHGILQARTLKCIAILFSRGSSWPRDRTRVLCIAGGFFTVWATREAQSESEGCSIVSDSLWPHGVHGILQARILEWVAFLLFRECPQPSDQTQVSHIARGFLTSCATRVAQEYWSEVAYPFLGGSSWPRNVTRVSCIAGGFFTNWTIREA